MSAKKRFSISKDLASNIRTTVQAVSSGTGQLHYDLMSLDVIDSDNENPRNLHITKQEIAAGLDPKDAYYKVKQRELDALAELAESIKKIGIRNAIEVYKDGTRYKIITGERRYLASLLSGQSHIPARISQKPDDFRLCYMQWSENINREDLTLIDKYYNLVKLAASYVKLNNAAIEPSVLQKILGTSTSHTYRYYALLKANSELLELIKLNRISNIKIIEEITRIKDAALKTSILKYIKESNDEVTSINKFKALLNNPAHVKQPAHHQDVNLGKIKNHRVARELFHIILQDARLQKFQLKFSDIDWRSEKTASKAFRTLITILEKELA